MTTTTSGQEIAYRTELQNHLRLFPLMLPEGMKRPNDVHSVLAFSIDRDGKLIEVKVAKSFGIKAVDDQALAWVKAIQPFPKMPSELKAPMKLTAEIVFSPKSIWNDEEARRKVNGVCRGC
jgi:TonB family protein